MKDDGISPLRQCTNPGCVELERANSLRQIFHHTKDIARELEKALESALAEIKSLKEQLAVAKRPVIKDPVERRLEAIERHLRRLR